MHCKHPDDFARYLCRIDILNASNSRSVLKSFIYYFIIIIYLYFVFGRGLEWGHHCGTELQTKSALNVCNCLSCDSHLR